jgi:hypothetical protein
MPRIYSGRRIAGSDPEESADAEEDLEQQRAHEVGENDGEELGQTGLGTSSPESKVLKEEFIGFGKLSLLITESIKINS